MRSSSSFTVLVALVCTLHSARWGSGQQLPDEANTACRGIISGTVPHPTDCTRYFVCWQGTGVAGQCSPNYVFNPRVMFCVHQSQYRCTTEPETTVAPPELTSSSTVTSATEPTSPGPCVETPWEAQFCRNHATELIRNPFNCTQYIDCERSPEANRRCPPGKLFSLSYQDCFPGNERCEMEPLAEDFCDGKHTGSYAHPYQCNRFVTCFRGAPRLDTCPPGYVFDEGRLRCVRGDVVKCSSLLGRN